MKKFKHAEGFWREKYHNRSIEFRGMEPGTLRAGCFASLSHSAKRRIGRALRNS